MENGFIMISGFTNVDGRVGLFHPNTNIVSLSEKSEHNRKVIKCLKISDKYFLTIYTNEKIKIWKYYKNYQGQNGNEKQCLIF